MRGRPHGPVQLHAADLVACGEFEAAVLLTGWKFLSSSRLLLANPPATGPQVRIAPHVHWSFEYQLFPRVCSPD